jgi:hypothetical protein
MEAESLTTLATHLSKEIELATQMIIEQRTKNNLLVALGPFIILGAISASSHAMELVSALSRRALATLCILLVISYAALGYLSAQIELNLWNQANRWREELALLYGLQQDFFVFPSSHLIATYVGIYAAIGLAFVAIFLLIVTVRRSGRRIGRSG